MSLTALCFREMEPTDAESVFLLAKRADAFSWSVNQFLSSLKAGDKVTLAYRDDVLIGYFVLRTVLDESELMQIAVDPNFQGKGFGRKLLTEAIKTAKLSGANRLCLEVRVSNTRARNLYETSGFTIDAIRKGYYRTATGREDAVLMTKRIAK